MGLLRDVKAKKKFLTPARKDWVAKFSQNATVVLLAGMVGNDLFLKMSWLWRGVVIGGLILGFCSGLCFATSKEGGD